MTGEGTTNAKETVFAKIIKIKNDLVFVGSFLFDNYRTVVMKMGYGGEVEWLRLFGEGEKDHEGQNVAALGDELLVCGCCDGIADPKGGSGWKAYLMKLDANGEKVWEKIFDWGTSACAYSVVTNKEYIYLFGEVRQESGNTDVFLLKLDGQGDVIWEKQFNCGLNVMASGLVIVNDMMIIGGSHKTPEGWKFKHWKVDENGEIIWEKYFDDLCIMHMGTLKDDILLAGQKGVETFLMKMSQNGEMLWGGLFGIGIATSVKASGENILMAGDAVVDGKNRPSFFIVDGQGDIRVQRIFDRDGYFEAVIGIDKGHVLSLQKPKPDNHAVIVVLDDKGDPL